MIRLSAPIVVSLVLVVACGSNSDLEREASLPDSSPDPASFEHNCTSESGTNFDCLCVNSFILSELDETQYAALQSPTLTERDAEDPGDLGDVLNLAETLDEQCAGVLTR